MTVTVYFLREIFSYFVVITEWFLLKCQRLVQLMLKSGGSFVAIAILQRKNAKKIFKLLVRVMMFKTRSCLNLKVRHNLLPQHENSEEPINSEGTEEEPTGYRFMDLSILSGIFKTLPCRECKQFTLALSENLQKRKGCASNLELHCQVCS